MSRRSFLAAGAQTSRLSWAGMFAVELANKLFDIELLAQAGIKLASANLDGSAKLIEPLDSLKQLATKLLLRCLRQGSCFGHRQLKGLCHIN
jgi:hypothetical protein